MTTNELEITGFLIDEGFATVWSQHKARAVLEQAGLTRPGKQAMALDKLSRAREVLDTYLLRFCGDGECGALAELVRAGRVVIEASPGQCAICGGSNNRRAALLLARACRQRGIERLLIVGGTPALHAELASLLAGTGLTLRCIDGKAGSQSKGDALPNLNWAQVLVIWASTPLPHKISVSYTDERPRDLPFVTVSKRGIESLCREVLRTVEGMGRH